MSRSRAYSTTLPAALCKYVEDLATFKGQTLSKTLAQIVEEHLEYTADRLQTQDLDKKTKKR